MCFKFKYFKLGFDSGFGLNFEILGMRRVVFGAVQRYLFGGKINGAD